MSLCLNVEKNLNENTSSWPDSLESKLKNALIDKVEKKKLNEKKSPQKRATSVGQIWRWVRNVTQTMSQLAVQQDGRAITQ